ARAAQIAPEELQGDGLLELDVRCSNDQAHAAFGEHALDTKLVRDDAPDLGSYVRPCDAQSRPPSTATEFRFVTSPTATVFGYTTELLRRQTRPIRASSIDVGDAGPKTDQQNTRGR